MVRWAVELALQGNIGFAFKWLSGLYWSLRMFALRHVTNVHTDTRYECSHWGTLRMFALTHVTSRLSPRWRISFQQNKFLFINVCCGV